MNLRQAVLQPIGGFLFVYSCFAEKLYLSCCFSYFRVQPHLNFDTLGAIFDAIVTSISCFYC